MLCPLITIDEYQEAGRKRIDWVAEDVPSGVYFCRLEASGRTTVKKMTLIR